MGSMGRTRGRFGPRSRALAARVPDALTVGDGDRLHAPATVLYDRDVVRQPVQFVEHGPFAAERSEPRSRDGEKEASMSTREAIIEVAEKYLFHGLVEHDGHKVPLGENVVRIEQGHNTGEGREALVEALAHDVMNVITGIRNVRWFVEGEQAVAFYDLDVTVSDLPVLIAERFRVVDGLIVEIEAIFHAQPATESAN